jgi:crotonobetainyl-CoA:carnitine CoA-transferase CaiB-like acyl-CoA transferase
MWKSVSRNKRSVTLDLRVAEGQELLRRLVEHGDVVVANTRPQTLQKWGLDYASLRAVNEKIVMLHITGYGLTGPKSERLGFGTLGEAMSGFANITGEATGPPTLPPFMLADGVASLNAAYAVMMALYHRDVHGTGAGSGGAGLRHHPARRRRAVGSRRPCRGSPRLNTSDPASASTTTSCMPSYSA